MNIYVFVRNPEHVELDEYVGFVVRAANEEQAKTMIFNLYEDEYEVKLIASGVAGEPTIILESFNAG